MSKQLLTQEELQQLQNIKQEIIAIASGLGELEYQKALIELDTNRLKSQIVIIKEREQVLLKSCGEKYGDGMINLETGEIDPRS